MLYYIDGVAEIYVEISEFDMLCSLGDRGNININSCYFKNHSRSGLLLPFLTTLLYLTPRTRELKETGTNRCKLRTTLIWCGEARGPRPLPKTHHSTSRTKRSQMREFGEIDIATIFDYSVSLAVFYYVLNNCSARPAQR